jgi:anti-sigma regulatory factor (Ser/Thr protein kinase)
MMSKVRARGEPIRRFIIDNVERHRRDIARVAAARFGVTRQAIHKHLRRLVSEGALTIEGRTRSRSYRLCPLAGWEKLHELTGGLTEDRIWMEDIAPALGKVPENVAGLWHYGITEMVNNVVDHSQGTSLLVVLKKTAAATEIAIRDDGIGIFKKIQGALNLLDERHAVLELAKGKFTTDPDRHTGEGIFFTSRMFDGFDILSGGVFFSHEISRAADWIMERDRFESGTTVWMKLSNHTSRTPKKVFDKFTSGDDYGFTKTVVPVKLARYGDDKLISRSQAKRLLARVDRFRTVILDFGGVESIGQAFADEVFRVFPREHPDLTLLEINANSAVRRMISRARSHGPAGGSA